MSNDEISDDIGQDGKLDLCECLLRGAKNHGRRSDPDHEPGDLQELLRAAWDLLTPVQRVVFWSRDDVKRVVLMGQDPEDCDEGNDYQKVIDAVYRKKP